MIKSNLKKKARTNPVLFCFSILKNFRVSHSPALHLPDHKRVAWSDVEAAEPPRTPAALWLAIHDQAALPALPDDQNAAQAALLQRSFASQQQRPAPKVEPAEAGIAQLVEERPIDQWVIMILKFLHNELKYSSVWFKTIYGRIILIKVWYYFERKDAMIKQ